jgi:hypothetical protein
LPWEIQSGKMVKTVSRRPESLEITGEHLIEKRYFSIIV